MRLITKLKDWQPLSLPVFLSILIFNKTQPLHSETVLLIQIHQFRSSF